MHINVTGNNNCINQDMDVDVNMNTYNNSWRVQERIINRTFVHKVS